MTGAQYIVDSLIRRRVTDAFGIPGGVILSLIYEMDNRREDIMPHLSYHEQSAGFAACGYAQSSGKLGVAYATRGPGFTNLITPIADAYCDSVPVLFITAHTASCPPEGMRVMDNQEIDSCNMVSNITKLALRIDDAETLVDDFERLCDTALEGRKGPVLLDVAANLLNQEIPVNRKNNDRKDDITDYEAIKKEIVTSILNASRPVILVGDGVNQAEAKELLHKFAKLSQIPIISSRFSHDTIGGEELYFGYLGSHGMRCANFIISKADLIISLGNRLHFPTSSKSFSEIFTHARLIRIEIDKGEFQREIPNSVSFQADVSHVLECLTNEQLDYGQHTEWIKVCNILRKELCEVDMNEAVRAIAQCLSIAPRDWTVVNDVGNNEFWVSRASVYCKDTHRTLYTKSFGSLGCSIAKAIGVYYATRKPVLCFVGDQGLQMSIQELQYISQHHLPIVIILVNNAVSGMIKDRQVPFGRFLHTTKESGFSSPSWRGVADVYGIHYCEMDETIKLAAIKYPALIELSVDDTIGLSPSLPKGTTCQDLRPALPKEKYEYLNRL